jgi:DNA-binding Lrp family transcriptional regulator
MEDWPLDRKDEEILRYFILHPEATVKDIAESLGIPRPTAQRRILNLRAVRHLRPIVAVNPNSLGYALRYRIDVTVSSSDLIGQMSLRELAQHIMGLQQDVRFKNKLLVENVHLLLAAQHDLSVIVRAKHHQTVLEFVTDGLRSVRGIRDTSTMQLAWSCIEELVTAPAK